MTQSPRKVCGPRLMAVEFRDFRSETARKVSPTISAADLPLVCSPLELPANSSCSSLVVSEVTYKVIALCPIILPPINSQSTSSLTSLCSTMLLTIPFPGAAFILTSNSPNNAMPTVSTDVQSSASLYPIDIPSGPNVNGPLHDTCLHPSGSPPENDAESLAGSALSFGHAGMC